MSAPFDELGPASAAEDESPDPNEVVEDGSEEEAAEGPDPNAVLEDASEEEVEEGPDPNEVFEDGSEGEVQDGPDPNAVLQDNSEAEVAEDAPEFEGEEGEEAEKDGWAGYDPNAVYVEQKREGDTDPEVAGFVADEAKGKKEGGFAEQLEEAWEQGGFMGVYSERHTLTDPGNYFSWFPSRRRFPEVNFNFIVLAGIDFLGEFQSVKGIGYQIDAKEIAEGGRNFSPHYLPFDGPGRRNELTLTWGAVSDTTLADWIEAVSIGWDFRRTVYVIQLARDGWPSRFMRFAGCWPTAWEGAELDTSGSAWALQSLTLVYDRFNMLTVPFDLGSMF